MRKGIPRSPETREKIRQAILGRKMPAWVGKKISKALTGRIRSPEERKKIGDGHRGKLHPERQGEKSVHWKGDEVGYHGIHKWIQLKKGIATTCEQCGKKGGVIDWANLDHKYKRKVEDYRAMCRSCHRKFDHRFNGYIYAYQKIS